MADSPAFNFVCEQLEARSALDRLEARGTVRLALKRAGLEARNVSSPQLGVVLEKVLPDELGARGISAADVLCASIHSALESEALDSDRDDSPDDVFRRLGGS